ncbi:MAG: shikimate dehydrogenase [Hydrogenophaga sp.]|uniref:shikimate dehydrogenase n=1 Tax=Hydrogenophaga sp. TaxID=1904254 RepID=UPI00271EF0AE|nr:shikimate dehydrogenase [Hydrogenophaga sp.]MDO9480982.1 shikimate dehydrogenase [Hydrogenophaga sp.]MDP1894616.1 shikimate dehydrogenase [Hydrogenophaga sp.]MDP3345665.1 shikimate dehydrogenase [Hydrogenophaga sp.]MDP3809042.1 shikimate dehydrogenase [Hydrogenophaga sp.]MDP3922093.1 shikimate dehydrogenase [Hydrogenophaga sp.]
MSEPHAPDRYAVIGHPIAHSKSPLIHGLFAQATGQVMEYTAIEAPLDGFAAVVHAFRAQGGRGLNVTLPFKLQAFELATDPLESARLAGAVNALKFEGDRIYADNFDGLGLVNDIQRNLGVSLAGKRVLLCGAGGATRGAIVPIALQKPALLAVANRSADKAHQLKRDFAAHVALQTGGFEDLAGESFDVVLNATSTGLTQAALPLPAGVFATGALAYELVYGKGLTPFLKQAQAAGATHIADGVGMLVEQAAEAFAWWRGVRPDTRPVIDRLTVPLV